MGRKWLLQGSQSQRWEGEEGKEGIERVWAETVFCMKVF